MEGIELVGLSIAASCAVCASPLGWALRARKWRHALVEFGCESVWLVTQVCRLCFHKRQHTADYLAQAILHFVSVQARPGDYGTGSLRRWACLQWHVQAHPCARGKHCIGRLAGDA